MKARHLIVQAYLHCLAFALIAMGVISLVGYLQIEHPTRHATVLLPDSALVSLLLGLVLLASARALRPLNLILAAPLLALALYSLAHNHLAGGADLGTSLVTGFLRVRSSLALIALCITLAFLGSAGGTPGRLLCRGIGLVIILVGLLSQLAIWLPGLDVARLGFKPGTASVANLFSILLGIAALLLPDLPARRERLLDRPSLAAGVIGALLTCLSWYLLSLQSIESLTRQSDLLLSKARLGIERSLGDHVALIQRLVERRQVIGTLPADRLWEQEADSYLRDFSSIRLISVLDSRLEPRLIRMRDASARHWLEHFLEDQAHRDWLTNAQRGSTPDMSHVERFDGSPSTVVIMPLHLPDDGGVLIAGLDLRDLLANILGGDQSGFIIRVYEADQLVLDSHRGRPQRFATEVGELDARLEHGMTWRLVSYLGDSQQQASMVFLPTLVMLFGLGFTFFLMVSQGLVRLTTERNERLRHSNQELEQSLQRQASLQALNQRIMTFSMDVLCSLDEQGRFTQLSPSSTTVFGYSPQELIGHAYLDYIVPEERERTQAEVRAIIDGSSDQPIRNRLLRKDGRIVHLLWSADWSANDRTLFAVAHDITRLVHNEAYAEDQRDILGMISTNQGLANILQAICQMAEAQDSGALCALQLMDRERRTLLLGAAPSLPEAYRRSHESLPSAAVDNPYASAAASRQLILIEDFAHEPRWPEQHNRLRQHGLRACWVMPLLSHHGEVLGTFSIHHRAPCGPDSDQLQLMATAAQLAAIAIEREHDQQRLQESEERYRSLFTFNPDPVFSFDLDGNFQSMNEAGCQLTGYREEDLIGQDFSLLAMAEEMPRVHNYFHCARKGEAQRYEVKCRTASGELLELYVTNLPMVVKERIVGVHGVAKNIGERNRMNRALHKALMHSERQAELLRCLSQTAVNMSGILDTQALLDYLAEQMRLLIAAHLSIIHLEADSGMRTQQTSAISLSDKYAEWTGSRPRFEVGGLYALIGESQQPQIMTQTEVDAYQQWYDGDEEKFLPLRGNLSVPLKNPAGKKLGWLLLSDKYAGEFDQDDLAIAQQFAQMTMTMLENNRLMREVLAGEQRLQTQLEFTSAITDSIVEGLIATDAQGLLTFVNPAAARLIGRPVEALPGEPLDRQLPLPVAEWSRCGEHELHGEFRLRNELGEELYLAYDSAPLQGSRGPNGWVVAFRDVSAQRRASQAMRERDQFFTLSLDMFCLISLQGHFIQVNPAFVTVLGYPAERLIDQPYLELIHGEDRPLIEAAVRRLQEGQLVQDLEARVSDSQGRLRWLQLSAALGEDQVIYCAAHDVTQRKADEQALQDTLRELERSNRELQEFAFVASHDLQEPLRKIQAFSERLESQAQSLSEEGRDYLQRMRLAAERMQSLIRDLLAYSRVTTRGQPFVTVELEQILDGVLQDMETSLESSGAEILRSPLPALQGDPTQLRQLLQNLLSNAVKFHQQNQAPRVRIYVERQAPGQWTLCIEDNGIGFEEKYLDRIFNPFQRLHGRQAYPGTGIGLAIVKKIVERHGASISASSRPGQGTTFRISFRT
ncbi:PAS domain S-box protein [Pseudomonas sp. SP16.1]|uniref:PAS domain S-box protein n=1 Tax=Pseudomonas sp. SP16.1 TaxID=3458854 RepID=UPI00404605A7